MANENFGLSFTTEQAAFWNDNTEGQVGAKSSVYFYDESVIVPQTGPAGNTNAIGIVFKENTGGWSTVYYYPLDTIVSQTGPAGNFAGMNIVTSENVGGQVGLPSGTFIFDAISVRDIIRYADESQIEADEVTLNGAMVADSDVEVWNMVSPRREVLDRIAEETFVGIEESWSVNTNSSATTGVVCSLPANAPAGTNYTFIKTASGSFEVEGAAGEFITVSGTPFVSMSLDAIGSKLTVISDGQPNSWKIVNEQGTTPGLVRKIFTDPRSINGIALWFDAQDSDTIVVTSSPDVDEWQDKSGNDWHLAQADAAERPHTGNTINGFPAIDFQADAHHLENLDGDVLTGQVGSVFAVLQTNSLQFPQYVFGSSADADNWITPIQLNAANNNLLTTRIGTPGSSGVFSSGTFPNAVGAIIEASSDGVAQFTDINNSGSGIGDFSGGDSGQWFGDVPNSDGFFMGALRRDTLLNPGGDFRIGELIVYDGVELSAEQRQDVLDYLTTKWSI